MNLYIQKGGVVGFERHRHSSDMEDLIVAAIGVAQWERQDEASCLSLTRRW